jgi:hypothetical protein
MTHHKGNSDFCTACGYLAPLLNLHEITGRCISCEEMDRPIDTESPRQEWVILISEWTPDLATRHNDDGSPIDGYSWVVHSQLAGYTHDEVLAKAKHAQEVLGKPTMVAGPVVTPAFDSEVGR